MILDNTKNEGFRDFLERLREERELTDIQRAVDIRHIATLVDQSEKALLFHNVIGYKTPVVSGIFRNQRRTALSMGCSKFSEIEEKLRRAIEQPVSPVYVKSAPHKEVIAAGDDVDLFKLPIPICSVYDGGPMMEWLGKEWDYASWSDSTKDSAIIGTVDECVAQLREHLAAGVQKLIFVPYKYEMGQIEIIAKEIIPRLKAARG